MTNLPKKTTRKLAHCLRRGTQSETAFVKGAPVRQKQGPFTTPRPLVSGSGCAVVHSLWSHSCPNVQLRMEVSENQTRRGDHFGSDDVIWWVPMEPAHPGHEGGRQGRPGDCVRPGPGTSSARGRLSTRSLSWKLFPSRAILVRNRNIKHPN